MITVLRLVLAYAVPTVIGYCLVIALERGKSRLAAGERWALGFALGSGVLTFFMFYLGILGLPLTFWTSSAILWPGLLLAGLTLRRRGREGEEFSRSRKSPAVRGRTGRCLVALLSVLLAWVPNARLDGWKVPPATSR